MVTSRAARPHRTVMSGEATAAPSAFTTLPLMRSETALPASERPMMETVGPMTTTGMRRSSHLTPATFTAAAMMTYTKPANTAPRIRPA